ncbi:hypothetical protein [Streptomyces tendae]|uniref:hypothetical protein n=1 Tax=Streptomyces tendae TaxID=1932 RepID=UPI0033BC1233
MILAVHDGRERVLAVPAVGSIGLAAAKVTRDNGMGAPRSGNSAVFAGSAEETADGLVELIVVVMWTVPVTSRCSKAAEGDGH